MMDLAACARCTRSSSAPQARGDGRASALRAASRERAAACAFLYAGHHSPLTRWPCRSPPSCHRLATTMAVWSAPVYVFSAYVASGSSGSRMDTGDGALCTAPDTPPTWGRPAPTSGLSAPTSFRRSCMFRALRISIRPGSMGCPLSASREQQLVDEALAAPAAMHHQIFHVFQPVQMDLKLRVAPAA